MHLLDLLAISEKRLDGDEFSFEWRIKNFSSLRKVWGGYYISDEFDFNYACWRFSLFPYDTNQISFQKCVTLKVKRGNECPPMTIQFTIAIKGAKERKMRIKKKHEFSNNSPSIAFVFPRHELNDLQHLLMPNDTLTFLCKFRTVAPNPVRGIPFHRDTSVSTGTPFHHDTSVPTGGKFEESSTCTCGRQSLGGEELQKSLQKLLQNGEDSDVILKVQGKKFHAHRAILRVRSPVFEAMFTHDMVEKQKGVVTIQDCDSESFSDFLEHVYTGSVDMISVSNVVSLYTGSEKYDLSSLKKACMEFIQKNLTVASFCNTISLAVKHGEKDLIECATAFFCHNSLEIVKTAEWQTFLQENFTFGNELIIKTLKHNLNK